MTARHVRTNRIAWAAVAAAIALWAGCGGGGGSTTILPDGGVVVEPTCDHQDDPGHLNVDIPTITLSGGFTLNGAQPPANEPFGLVFLVDAAGDAVVLGQLSDRGYVARHVIPGTYDVYYEWANGDTVKPPALPRNFNVRLQHDVALTSSRSFNVDIPTITLSGTITVNGQPPPTTQRQGSIALRNIATDDTVVLASLDAPSYSAVQLVPGTYDVYYYGDNVIPATQPSVPRNTRARLQANVALTSSQTFHVDVPSVTLTGAITVNGAARPATNSSARITLRNTATGDTVLLGETGTPNYVPAQIVPGTYDVYYSWSTLDATLPHNTNARLHSQVSLTSTQTFNVDVPSITLSGTITVDGAVPPASARSASVSLSNASTGDTLVLGTVGAASYPAVPIVPGSFDIYYGLAPGTTASSLPRNTHARLRSVELTSPQTLDIDVPTIKLSGMITVNGALPAATERFGDISLRDLATGDTCALGKLGDASYAAVAIVAGTYDVFYAWDFLDTVTPPALPRNLQARLRSAVALGTSQTLNIDVPAVTLSGAITVDGVVPTDTAGAVNLINRATGDRIPVGSTGAATFATKQVVPGTYDISYRWSGEPSSPPTAVPRNVNHIVGCTRFARP